MVMTLPAPRTLPRSEPSSPGLQRSIRRPIVFGAVIVGLFFGGFGSWAAITPLSSAAVAPGVVSLDGSRKTVQHLEGGIIHEILVRDGDRVTAGQPLVTLASVQARSTFEQLTEQRMMLIAKSARLRAEQNGAEEITLPPELTARRADPKVAEIVDAQLDLFETRRQSLADEKSILAARVGQYREEIAGLQAQVTAQRTQVELMDQEIATVSDLVERGLTARPRLLELQRNRAAVDGERGANEASIARLRRAIGETELEIDNLDSARQAEIAAEIAEVQSQMATLAQQLTEADDVLARTAVTAPVDGTVVELQFHTPGGVVGPGEPILYIVPSDDELMIDARVSPRDIDSVHPGLQAQVHLTAFAQRNLPQIKGVVRTVSADSLTDERTGQAYFLARIEVDGATLEEVGSGIELVPGMPADVLIVTGERTLLDFLVQPLMASIRNGLREN